MISGLNRAPISSDDRTEQPTSPTYQAVMNRELPKSNAPYSSEGKISRSFRALEQDLHAVQGTAQAPKSIFDQRRQQQKR